MAYTWWASGNRDVAMAPGEASPKAPLMVEVVHDGGAALIEERTRRRKIYFSLFAAYTVCGLSFYWVVEEWDPLEVSVFSLSVLTGCGYGHLIPRTQLGKAFTAGYILCGMVIFASFAGEILEVCMSIEIEAMTKVMAAAGASAEAKRGYEEAALRSKRHHFLTGLTNLIILLCAASIMFCLVFGEGVINAVYLAFVSVLKLDSLCLLNSVVCSHGWHSSSGGNPWSLAFAICWYVLTYGIIAHFLVATSTYLGVNPAARMTTLKRLNVERLNRMDSDGDGTVTRSEFLRDRLIQGGICSQEDVDAILSNFDELDVDGSGVLTKEDIVDLNAKTP
mmetsp:Transcript_83141/g.254143  ORF Transcript_83141/g.254143 Transcript_83141/m.254143 type:complete len:335 (-) Transcript_83141:107-1111(-)